MFTKNVTNAACDILDTQLKGSTVTIIIGENGTGKSSALDAAAACAAECHPTICISNTPFHKFTTNNKKIKLLRGKFGYETSEQTIKNAIISLHEDITRKYSLMLVLQFCEYEDIGINISQLSSQHISRFKSLTENHDIRTTKRFVDLHRSYGNTIFESIIPSIAHHIEQRNNNKTIWLGQTSTTLEPLPQYIPQLLAWEQLLTSTAHTRPFPILLKKKNDETIRISDSSSGEISFMSTMSHTATLIKDKAHIFIDEPENSLHPRWQKKYVSNFFDIFNYYSPHLIIATHSPIIVAGALESGVECRIFKADKCHLTPLPPHDIDIENSLIELFQTATPINRGLSNKFTTLIHNTEPTPFAINTSIRKLCQLSEMSMTEKQKRLAETIKTLIFETARENQI